MAFYKVLKSGHFSEERFNQVGAIVEIDENAARVAEERGFLQITTKKPTPVKPEKEDKEAPKLKGAGGKILGVLKGRGKTKKK